jgi:hypothetical protein
VHELAVQQALCVWNQEDLILEPLINEPDWRDQVMSGSQIAVMVLVELWVITAAIAALLFYLLRNSRRNVAELRAALKINKNDVDSYDQIIGRELERTKQRLKNLLQRERLPSEAMLVTRLRANFLSAEKHARTYRENQEAFWKALEEGLKDMIALAKLKVEKTTGSEREAWQQKLEQSEQKVDELELVRGTFSAPLNAVNDARAQAQELEQLRELKIQHVDKIEKLITEIAVLRSASIQAELPVKKISEAAPSNEIDGMASIPTSYPESSPVFIRSVQEVKYAQSAMADTLQQIDTYQANSNREIGRLKEMCMEQRAIIKELRKQLKHGNGESAEQAELASQQADNIERLLRDAEMCVMTLEQENANLQSEICTLRAQANVPDEPTLFEEEGSEESDIDVSGEKSSAYYHKQIQQFRDRIQQQDEVARLNQQLRYFVAKALECQGDKALMELLTLTLSQFGLCGCLQVKTNDRTLAATFGNGVDSKDSNLLNSIVVESAVTALAENTIYASKPVKILIKQTEASKLLHLTSNHILELTELSARQFDILSSKEKQLVGGGERQKFATAVKKSLNNIKIQFKYQGEESKRVADTMMEDLKIAMSLISLSDAEERRMIEIIEEAGKRLNILVTNGSLIEKAISGLLSSVDELAMQS